MIRDGLYKEKQIQWHYTYGAKLAMLYLYISPWQIRLGNHFLAFLNYSVMKY